MRKVFIEVDSAGETDERKRSIDKFLEATPSSGGAMTTGAICGFDPSGAPIVTLCHGNRVQQAVARRAVARKQCREGAKVVLLLEDSDPGRPIIVGVLQEDDPILDVQREAVLDGERLLLTAGKEIVLRCGNASLTLTRAGKVLIEGAYVLTRSSGVNRIKGGSVQIN
jgi:hypothetical protein